MENRVLDHAGRIAAVEGAVVQIVKAVEKWDDKADDMRETLHKIEASMGQVNKRLEEGAARFVEHEAGERAMDKRLMRVEAQLESLNATVNGEGPSRPGLVKDVASLQTTGSAAKSIWAVGKAILAAIGAAAVALLGVIAPHISWK